MESKEGSYNFRDEKDTDNNRIVLPTLTGTSVISSKDIIRCEAKKTGCTFHLACGTKINVAKGLKFYEDKLNEWNFLRIHKSIMINLRHVEKFNEGKKCSVILSDKAEVPMATHKKNELIQRFTFSFPGPKPNTILATELWSYV